MLFHRKNKFEWQECIFFEIMWLCLCSCSLTLTNKKKLLDIRKREGERNNIDVIFDFLNIDSAKIIYHSEHLVWRLFVSLLWFWKLVNKKKELGMYTLFNRLSLPLSLTWSFAVANIRKIRSLKLCVGINSSSKLGAVSSHNNKTIINILPLLVFIIKNTYIFFDIFFLPSRDWYLIKLSII